VTAAYTGLIVTWDNILKSDLDLGPGKIEFGPVDMKFETPVPGNTDYIIVSFSIRQEMNQI
jgi:hypothetical protein